MQHVPFYDLTLTEGFWAQLQARNREVTVQAVYDRFLETGRIPTMDCAEHEVTPHCFWASDVFKWIEGAAYILEQQDDPTLRKLVTDIVNDVEKGVSPDGYYSSYYNSPAITASRFSDRNMHELYTLGHMFEAGVAMHHATGDEKLLNICKRAADLVYDIFLKQDSAAFTTPGHEEIELALVRLYRATGEKKYLELSEFFVNRRGSCEKDTPIGRYEHTYDQSHLPVVQQREATGHAVRAVYLYCALADLAAEKQDAALFAAADRLFTDIYEKKLYITGGIGALHSGEAFSQEYHLPNFSAYTETCAALGLALFCRRMYAITPDGRYGDAAERAIYNGMLSGLSLSGDAFFYENPLEIDLSRQAIPRQKPQLTQRVKVFSCSCCPPNLVRFIPSVADMIYTYDQDRLYVHQYIPNEGTVDGASVCLQTRYPAEGDVRICYNGEKHLVLRRPAWCRTVLTDAPYREEKGYLYFDTNRVSVTFVMEPVYYRASDAVHENAGRVALMRGPIVYCAEGQDQDHPLFSLRVDPTQPVRVSEEQFGGLPVLYGQGVASIGPKTLYAPCQENADPPCPIRFIPYYTFANRGADDMQVWLLQK